jgi:hypothetical protein
VAFVLGRRKRQSNTHQLDTMRDELHAAVEQETAAHVEELRRTVARARADAMSLLADEERRLTTERERVLADHERRLGELLAASLTTTEQRLDDRLRQVSDDLDRAEAHAAGQLERLERRRREAIAEVEARITAEAAELGSSADEQRRSVQRLRAELERAASAAVSEALDELEEQTVERRRAIQEITERLRVRETEIAEGIERAGTDLRAQLDVSFVEAERRLLEQLHRVLEREVDRHVQAATLMFDERMREIREDAATRLSRELDRAIDVLARDELPRRLDATSP